MARFLNIHRSGVLTALAWLVPHETAAVWAQVLCTPYNHAPCHFMQSHIRKVYACLAVTCPPRFWQNDRDLLLATAVTRGWNGYRNKSQHRKLTLEKKILPPLSQLSKILYDKVLIDTELLKLQALVYAILPSTTAVFSYAIGSRKLSANEQFFGGVQTVVSLLQTQIKQGVSFIATNKVYTSTNKTTIVKSRRNSFSFFLFFFFLLLPGWTHVMFTCVFWR